MNAGWQWRAALWMAMVALTPIAQAQQRQQSGPRIGYIYPAGGKQGTTFRILVGGQFLDDPSAAYITGDGVKTTVVEHFKPITQREAIVLRDKLEQLIEKRRLALMRGGTTPKPAWTEADDRELAEIRRKLSTFQRRPAAPAIVENVTVEVTLSADAVPGPRELRLNTAGGLTNPLPFHVGQLPEVIEKEAKQSAAPTETAVTLPATINGQIMPGDVDRYRFTARRGQHLVAAVDARSLVPYIADAVPGWFQAVLSLRDSKGIEVAFADDHRFSPDPVLHYLIPADGEYVIEIRDSIYRGREDFTYRIALGELPFVTSIFPMGAQAGTKPAVELRGWNLPMTRMMPDTREAGITTLTARRAGVVSNRMPFSVDELPEVIEREPNDQPGSAQLVAGGIINGRIDKPGDWDVYRFEGRAGEQVVAEVIARRLNSPVDSALKLTDSAGKQLACNDDHDDKGSGLHTHHADSRLSAVLPASGAYYVHIGDAQNQGGPEYGYRLRISAPRPDFELRVTPSSISVRPGVTTALTVYALRKDGFAGAIGLSLKDPPAGFRLSGARVPGSADQVRITLTAPTKELDEPIELQLIGTAKIAGREVVRPAIPAEDMMQAFFYRHLVPAERFLAAVSGRWSQRSALVTQSPAPVKITAGGTAHVQVAVPGSTMLGKVTLELSDPPEGLTIRSVTPTRRGSEIVLQADPAKLKPGMAGNLIVHAFADRPAAPDDAKSTRRRVPLGTLPAIPFEVVGP